jgi:hypothetical protein
MSPAAMLAAEAPKDLGLPARYVSDRPLVIGRSSAMTLSIDLAGFENMLFVMVPRELDDGTPVIDIVWQLRPLRRQALWSTMIPMIGDRDFIYGGMWKCRTRWPVRKSGTARRSEDAHGGGAGGSRVLGGNCLKYFFY